MKPEPSVTITPYRDGPYVVRGPFRLVDHLGNEIEVRRKSIALCRCGSSDRMPFCDGSHKLVGFTGDASCDVPVPDLPAELT
jgi:CDGSH-type Zn-finger protein